MGADIVGWITCPLQRGLGVDEFFRKLKLVAYKRQVEAEFVNATEYPGMQIRIQGTNRPTEHLTYADVCKFVAGFEEGIPQCKRCPISQGQTLGCYKYITYPIDEVFERLAFDFFVADYQVEDSICNQLYADIVSHCPRSGTPWHTQRGATQGALAALPAPLEHIGTASNYYIDSAQILNSLFISLESPAFVVAYTNFWAHLDQFATLRHRNSRTMEEVRSMMLMFFPLVSMSLNELASVIVRA